jgi:hypothetical protein
MRTVTITQSFKIDPITIFDVLDDLAVTGMPMTKSSMPMMGGKMEADLLLFVHYCTLQYSRCTFANFYMYSTWARVVSLRTKR